MDTLNPQLVPSLACDSCRIKKLKCSKERPSCGACVQNQRKCHYSGRIIRSPLTRAYLSSVERRLQKVESLLKQLHPDINIDEALVSDFATDKAPRPSHDNPVAAADSVPSPVTPRDEPISERVPDEADGFDWHEDVGDLTDGMAALSVEPKGTGYLGSTAGVFFLRSLLFWTGQSKYVSTNAGNLGTFSDRSIQFDASSHLAQAVASQQVKERLMDGYFSIYHRTYPFVHEATFRAQFHEVIPRPQQRSFQMLLHTILALGAWCLNDTQTDLDDDLYHTALSFGEDESLFESANLTFVQALVLLSNLSQKRDKPNTGSNFLGLATRMALSLGLHRELPGWDISLLQREMRRRVWWGLYIFDSGASTTFGRPILLPGSESMDVRPVLNIPDEALTARTTVLPEEQQVPTLYSGLRWQSEFHIHSNHISNLLLSSSGVSSEDALSLDQTLSKWSETLPVYLRLDHQILVLDDAIYFAKCRLWWRYWNLKIILLRQFLLKRAVEQSRRPEVQASDELGIKCRDKAVSAARSTITSISGYLAGGVSSRLVAWYSTFFIFHASLVICLAAVGNAESPDIPEWRSDLDTVRHVFRVILANNRLAMRCADVLDLLTASSNHMNAENWDRIELDPPWMNFSTWPSDAGDFTDPLSWPEAGGPF